MLNSRSKGQKISKTNTDHLLKKNLTQTVKSSIPRKLCSLNREWNQIQSCTSPLLIVISSYLYLFLKLFVTLVKWISIVSQWSMILFGQVFWNLCDIFDKFPKEQILTKVIWSLANSGIFKESLRHLRNVIWYVINKSGIPSLWAMDWYLLSDQWWPY